LEYFSPKYKQRTLLARRRRHGGTALKFPITVVHQNIQVRCLRSASTTRTINDVTYDVVPRATIDVQTASDPFQLFFAEEWIPPAPIKEIDRLMSELQATEFPFGTVISSVLSPRQFFEANEALIGRSVSADGAALPPNSAYEKATQLKNTPDLTGLSKSIPLIGITSGLLPHGSNISGLLMGPTCTGPERPFQSDPMKACRKQLVI
jgi:hypothetical protein